jgi:two-component system, OmpR family, KDP operon response regulator KdpE
VICELIIGDYSVIRAWPNQIQNRRIIRKSPIAKSSINHQSQITESEMLAQPPTVLVVDDDHAVRRSLCRMLELYGYRTADSGTGIGAFASLRLSAPDAVLLNLRLPGDISGFDVIRRMREHPPWREILVPMTSSSADDAQIQRLQPRFVLRKPFGLEDLLDVVGASVDQSAPQGPAS